MMTLASPLRERYWKSIIDRKNMNFKSDKTNDKLAERLNKILVEENNRVVFVLDKVSLLCAPTSPYDVNSHFHFMDSAMRVLDSGTNTFCTFMDTSSSIANFTPPGIGVFSNSS
eukprot:NODE_260_length_12610_cov_0.413076.p9 type:complete len:114 gc:universal NODE_260_length_12610_cov_0.413076:2968-2627(-)